MLSPLNTTKKEKTPSASRSQTLIKHTYSEMALLASNLPVSEKNQAQPLRYSRFSNQMDLLPAKVKDCGIARNLALANQAPCSS